MPRPEEPKESSTSFVDKVLNFFGFGKKKGNEGSKKQRKNNNKQQGESKPKPPQKVRVAKPRSNNNKGGNPAATPKKDKPRRERKLNNKPVQNGRIYVGNLAFEATESEIEDLFKGFGDVRKVEIVYNSHTFKSKGFGFVEMRNQEDAQRAVDVLHGQPFMGRELLVRAANERSAEVPAEQPAPAPAEAPAPVEAPAPAPEPAEAPAPAAAEPVVEVSFAPQSGVSVEVTEPPAEQQQ